MDKIRRISLSVESAHRRGYDLTCYQYCEGDRSPRHEDTYRALTHEELLDLVATLLDVRRPGWEYSTHLEQPPLWSED